MAKLVVLNEGLTGQSYELKVDKTTIGRVDDNTFQIAHPSVSSHHCEVLLKGDDVVVRDLGSTNGTFIGKDQITTEAVLKSGQVVRFGQVEVRLESGTGSSAPGSMGASSSPGKRPVDSTMVINKGVSFDQLQQGPHGLDTAKTMFTKKTNKTNKYFIIGGIVFIVVIAIAFLIVLSTLGKNGH